MSETMITRPERMRLSVRDPQLEALVRNLDSAGVDLEAVRAFGRHVTSARNAWSIRKGGALAHRRISRVEADAELRKALDALKNGGARHG